MNEKSKQLGEYKYQDYPCFSWNILNTAIFIIASLILTGLLLKRYYISVEKINNERLCNLSKIKKLG